MKRYKNYVINGLVLAVFIGVIVLLAKENFSQSETGGATSLASLVASEQGYDFGEISMSKGTVEHTFTVVNSDSEPVEIKKIYTSCMCTQATLVYQGQTKGPFGMPGHGPLAPVKESIAPGESAEIIVVFDPAAHGPAGVGLIERAVFLETAQGGKLTLDIKAKVTP